ncbi:hypothetical protein OE88DRAFT_1660346, partial [Heliocybe sulcata]
MRNIAAPSSRKMGADSAKKSATRKVRFLKRGEADKNEPVNAEGRERSIDKHGKQPSASPKTDIITDLEEYAADNESSSMARHDADMVHLQYRLETLDMDDSGRRTYEWM